MRGARTACYAYVLIYWDSDKLVIEERSIRWVALSCLYRRCVLELLRDWFEWRNAKALLRQGFGGHPSQAKDGGAEGIRTPDLVRARDALSQLSHCPTRTIL